MSEPTGEAVVGIMPAAGRATRSARLPCSKEIYPLELTEGEAPARARPVCADLLAGFRLGGADRAIIVIRPGKWDIPAFLGDGTADGVRLAYIPLAESPGVPWTVSAALPFAAGARILFGFPDVAFRPATALADLLAQQRRSRAEVTLGLFPARRPELVDMVDVADDTRVRDIVIKPARSSLAWTWMLACWSPRFSDFLLDDVAGHAGAGGDGERHMGDVVRAAVLAGHRVDSVAFGHGTYRDIGTPAELARALQGLD